MMYEWNHVGPRRRFFRRVNTASVRFHFVSRALEEDFRFRRACMVRQRVSNWTEVDPPVPIMSS